MNFGGEDPKAHMKIGKPGRDRIKPVLTAVNSPIRGAVGHQLNVQNDSFSNRQFKPRNTLKTRKEKESGKARLPAGRTRLRFQSVLLSRASRNSRFHPLFP